MRILLIALLFALSLQLSLWDLQGFGTDMNIIYNYQLVVSTQTQFEQAVQSNVLIRLAPNRIITLTKIISFTNHTNIIIQGPGTITQFGLYFTHCTNVIIRDVRILNASIYGILIYHSNAVVIDHCTILDASRTDIDRGKCIDVTEQSTNVTLSYNLLGYTYPVQQLHKFKGVLIANFNEGPVSNVSIHHNLFYCDYQRSPEISSRGLFDMRQNVIFNYTEYGSRIREGAEGNFVQNWYIGGKKDPLVFSDQNPIVYSTLNTWKFNGQQNRKIQDTITHSPFIVPVISSRNILNVVKTSGCLTRQKWEMLVISEITPFLN